MNMTLAYQSTTLDKLINAFERDVVFKNFNADADADMELNNMISVLNSGAPHTVLYTETSTEMKETMLYFRFANDPNSKKYLIYKRMDGDMLEFIKIQMDRRTQIKLVKQCEIQTVEFLHAIHKKNILHCDIKPDNILFKYNAADNTYSFAIGDYGLVNLDVDNCPNGGTPKYTSPLIIYTCHENPDVLIQNLLNHPYFKDKLFDFKAIIDEHNSHIYQYTLFDKGKINDLYAAHLSAYFLIRNLIRFTDPTDEEYSSFYSEYSAKLKINKN